MQPPGIMAKMATLATVYQTFLGLSTSPLAASAIAQMLPISDMSSKLTRRVESGATISNGIS